MIAGADFDFRLSLKVIDGEDLLPLLLRGLKLLEVMTRPLPPVKHPDSRLTQLLGWLTAHKRSERPSSPEEVLGEVRRVRHASRGAAR